MVILDYFNFHAAQWMKINVIFTDLKMKSLPAVTVQNNSLKLFLSVNQKVSQFH